jgi:predicted metal-binding protein
MTELIRARPTAWKTVILLCGKCARKMDGGYGPNGKEKLRTVLREAFRENDHRRDVRIIETRCMGICPRKAVTALNASRPARLLTIPKGTAVNEAMTRLMLEEEHQAK